MKQQQKNRKVVVKKGKPGWHTNMKGKERMLRSLSGNQYIHALHMTFQLTTDFIYNGGCLRL